jgi:hypothetical protein
MKVLRYNCNAMVELLQDMDIFYFGNPLKYLFETVPDADFAHHGEYWDWTFPTEKCK